MSNDIDNVNGTIYPLNKGYAIKTEENLDKSTVEIKWYPQGETGYEIIYSEDLLKLIEEDKAQKKKEIFSGRKELLNEDFTERVYEDGKFVDKKIK